MAQGTTKEPWKKALQEYTSTIAEVIAGKCDPGIFGNHLVAKGFLNLLAMNNKVASGTTPTEKVTNLLIAVSTDIEKAQTPEQSRMHFNNFLEVLRDLDLWDLVQQLEKKASDAQQGVGGGGGVGGGEGVGGGGGGEGDDGEGTDAEGEMEVAPPMDGGPPQVDRYCMDKGGLALIIVNINFDVGGPRVGAENHSKIFADCWNLLGYSVKARINCTSHEIVKAVEKYAKEAARNHDSFVCCISSHGEDGKVQGTDNRLVSLESLANCLTTDEVKKLRDKPKMFFIQACRRDELPNPQPYDAPHAGKYLPGDSDFFFGLATTPNTKADRNLYIPELCTVLKTHYKHLDLLTMVTMVHGNVVKKHHDRHNDYKQQPQLVSTLRKQICFKRK